jgi:2-polyprenyl-3-methyl-5-hydroxy-6-metoxy-1,4-benzoquinol methylase
MSETVRAFWNSQATTFDEEPDHGLLEPAIRDAWRRLLLEYLPPPPAHVVDLGCGTGTLSVLLAEAGYRVQGLDLADEMLATANSQGGARQGLCVLPARRCRHTAV